MSRRRADAVIAEQRVVVNQQPGRLGQEVYPEDQISLDGKTLKFTSKKQVIMLNKPAGYVCSRIGQGNKTIYDLLPPELHDLKPVGRLDKDSSGLLLLTNDGQLAQKLTHPSFKKSKVYLVQLDKPLSPSDKVGIENGVELEDGLSKLQLGGKGKNWEVTLYEGRNRQIRRTFATLGYKVKQLYRTQLGKYKLLDDLKPGAFREL